ncbi:MAG TPA: prolipoprotein diacylglyceryl transferase [Spirochaetota bacterium]|nr:prolipoprotein diacylglyceryl transferase [Spirochaetota bacterium]HOM39127.1 prolipoprotein diacylglyceryl transferase [Spirochaetota bacterium]HPQ50010.1 prolipoprotein diacylglyceryl transferase [Spirochaetota bacterium]
MIHNIDPVIFQIGPLSIRYYGLLYMAGFVITYIFLSRLSKIGKISLSKKDIDDFIFYSVIGVVLGARLFEVIFYEPSYYFSNPFKIFAIWEGGLSFHGGIFGVFVVTLIFCKKQKISIKVMGDLLSLTASISLFFGRIANFINGELYGIPVDNQVNPPWYAVKFLRTDPLGLYRYPTQILESLKNLFIFFVLFYLYKKLYGKNNKIDLYHTNYNNGIILWVFILLYGIIRFFIEFLKDVYKTNFLGLPLTKGHWLCIPMIILGITGLLLNYRMKLKDRV